MKTDDRFRGCLIGGAAGDALGYAVEFLNEDEIFGKYGEKGITEYDLYRGEGRISDDTQMTLFTAEGLLRAEDGGYAASINRAYIDWLKTQEEPLPARGGGSKLLADRRLYSQRAPGNTCMSALSAGGGGTTGDPINGSKGCGGVMRVAPVGLYLGGKGAGAAEAARLGADAAALTHGDPLGWMPAAVMAQIIYEMIWNGADIPGAVARSLDTAKEMWPDTEKKAYLIALIEKAADLSASGKEDIEAVSELGEGWVGEEALAIAVFCAMRYPGDIDRGLIAAVNHSGDSDSTGAVAGNIIGANIGYSRIPEKYTEKLELRDLILGIADDLWNSCRD